MMIKCPCCGSELTWENDFDADRFRFADEPQLEDGIVSTFSCSCGVTAERYIPFSEEETPWLTYYMKRKDR